ncbi:MAG: hypothetical protein M3P96_11080 [Actinomycetota bacterium]|nr:hypothetical protein [Actinomycetota bacterium]
MGEQTRGLPAAAAVTVLLLGVTACVPAGGQTQQPTPSPTPSTVTREVAAVPVGEGPVGLALDDRGRLWSVASGDGTVARVDPASEEVALRVRVGERPLRAAWWAGGLWVTVAGDKALVRVDGRTGAVTDRVPVGGAPDGIVAAFGSLWAVLPAEGLLVRVDPDPALPLVREVLDVGRGSHRVTAGGAALWVSDYTSGTVVRVEPATGLMSDPIRVCLQPQGMLARDGLLWVACTGSGEVVALDERAGSVERHNAPVRTVAVDGIPESLAPATDGSLWVSLRDGPALALLDPRDDTIRSRWPVGSLGPRRDRGATAGEVVLAGPRVWLSAYVQGTVAGVDVTPQGR